MQPYSSQSKTYPQFVLKAESKLLCGSMCVAVSGVYRGMASLAVTLFDQEGKQHFDSFSVKVLKETLTVAIKNGDLVSTLEQLYLRIQVVTKNCSNSTHVH